MELYYPHLRQLNQAQQTFNRMKHCRKQWSYMKWFQSMRRQLSWFVGEFIQRECTHLIQSPSHFSHIQI